MSWASRSGKGSTASLIEEELAAGEYNDTESDKEKKWYLLIRISGKKLVFFLVIIEACLSKDKYFFALKKFLAY